jgi:hypothetical protein
VPDLEERLTRFEAHMETLIMQLETRMADGFAAVDRRLYVPIGVLLSIMVLPHGQLQSRGRPCKHTRLLHERACRFPGPAGFTCCGSGAGGHSYAYLKATSSNWRAFMQSNSSTTSMAVGTRKRLYVPTNSHFA